MGVGQVSKVGAKIVIFFGFAIICLHWSGYILIRLSGQSTGSPMRQSQLEEGRSTIDETIQGEMEKNPRKYQSKILVKGSGAAGWS